MSSPVAPSAPTADPVAAESLLAAAREALTIELGAAEQIGEYLGTVAEDDVAATVMFAATERGYQGWHWSVTMAQLPGELPTVSEIVVLPGAGALVAPAWVPWEQRIQPGDIGPGDLLPTPADDPRLVPGYVESDDPAVEEVALEVGLGRVRVMSRDGRFDAAERWHDGPLGPRGDLALQAPGTCAGCGFYLPLSGSLGALFGACGNEYSPADGRVVDAGFGCGAHSEAFIEAPALSAASPAVIDELRLEVHARGAGDAVLIMDADAPLVGAALVDSLVGTDPAAETDEFVADLVAEGDATAEVFSDLPLEQNAVAETEVLDEAELAVAADPAFDCDPAADLAVASDIAAEVTDAPTSGV